MAADMLSRLVLNSICRASHVRLPTATFTSLLDELPLARGELSSSLMQVSCSPPLDVQWLPV